MHNHQFENCSITMPDPKVIHLIVARAGIKPPQAAISACQELQKNFEKLQAAHAKLNLSGVAKEYEAMVAKSVDGLVSGESSPDTLQGVTIESLRNERKVKSVAISEATKRVCAGACGHQTEIEAAVVAGLIKFEKEVEATERKACAEWGLEFEPGPILKAVTHVRLFAEQVVYTSQKWGRGVGAPPMGQVGLWFAKYAI